MEFQVDTNTNTNTNDILNNTIFFGLQLEAYTSEFGLSNIASSFGLTAPSSSADHKI